MLLIKSLKIDHTCVPLMMKCCIAVQEEKIAALQSFAEQLIGADHYAKPEIFNRRKEVLDR